MVTFLVSPKRIIIFGCDMLKLPKLDLPHAQTLLSKTSGRVELKLFLINWYNNNNLISIPQINLN